MQKRSVIIDYLKEAIHSGGLTEGDKIPSEYELAEKFNVNKKTANVAVSTLVTEGYLRRGKGAAGTRVAKTGIYPRGVITFLGCMLDSFNFWSLMVKGAQDEAIRRNYALQFIEYPNNQLVDLWPKLIDFKISGMLACSYGLIQEQLPFPVMHVDHLPPDSPQYHSVNSDNFAAGQLIAKHLLDQKHVDIVFIQKHYEPHMHLRSDGFVAALEERGIGDARSRVISTASEPAFAAEIIHQKFPETTAIVYDCDHGALEMARFLFDSGVKIPEQFSIAGFGALTRTSPFVRITSVEQNPIAMGSHACSRLIDIIEGKSSEVVKDVLPVQLFAGNTVAEPSLCRPFF